MSDSGGAMSDENDDNDNEGVSGVSGGSSEGVMRGFGTATSTAESAERWWRQQRAR